MGFFLGGRKKGCCFARTLVLCAIVAGCLVFSSTAQASITINFDFDNTNYTWSDTQKAAMNNAATGFSNMFGSHFSNSGSITLQATAYDDPEVNVLASAGSKTVWDSAGYTGTFGANKVVRNILVNGTDLNGAEADGVVNVNFAYFDVLDINATVPAGTYDFYSTLYHEFIHTLGFASGITQSGDDVWGNYTEGYGKWALFDQYLVDKNGNRVVGNDYVLNQAIWDAASIGGVEDGMYFNGPNAVAANGGDLIHLFSPTTWEPGSSISHLDDQYYDTIDLLMEAYAYDGPNVRDLSDIEVGMLQDLGYTATAIPLPSALIMLLPGVVGVLYGHRARRRR